MKEKDKPMSVIDGLAGEGRKKKKEEMILFRWMFKEKQKEPKLDGTKHKVRQTDDRCDGSLSADSSPIMWPPLVSGARRGWDDMNGR